MFLDEITITVRAGSGGRGCVSFRREKYVPRGGPDGGDGGKGGDIAVIADPNTDTLSDFAHVKVFRAGDSHHGEGKNRAGRGGRDLLLRVPVGTIVRDKQGGAMVADLAEVGAQVLVAHGGRGGYGNAHFTSSIRQAPDFAERGEPGEERRLHLTLKLVADVAIVGLPNVGKSTLISVISAAKPKIADYPFTTLVPNLGVVHVGRRRSGSSRAPRQARGELESRGRSFVVCDIPGLIEGAAQGKGLGHQFLRHIERCGILLHLLDVSREDLVQDYHVIRRELEAYSPILASKRELILLTKIDLLGGSPDAQVSRLQAEDIPIFAAISAVAHHGIQELLQQLLPLVLEERTKRVTHSTSSKQAQQREPLPVLRPHLTSTKMGAFVIEECRTGDQRVIRIRGKRLEQFTVMTEWSQSGGVQRFRDVLKRTGVTRAIERLAPDESTHIVIGDTDVTAYWK